MPHYHLIKFYVHDHGWWSHDDKKIQISEESIFYVSLNISVTSNILRLQFYWFQTYYITITAVTLAGNVEVTTDGVTVVQENAVLSGIVINDGQNCTMTGLCSLILFLFITDSFTKICWLNFDFFFSLYFVVDNGTLFKHHFEVNINMLL